MELQLGLIGASSQVNSSPLFFVRQATFLTICPAGDICFILVVSSISTVLSFASVPLVFQVMVDPAIVGLFTVTPLDWSTVYETYSSSIGSFSLMAKSVMEPPPALTTIFHFTVSPVCVTYCGEMSVFSMVPVPVGVMVVQVEEQVEPG